MSFKFGVLANFVTFLRSLQYFPSSSGCCFFLDKVISIGDNGHSPFLGVTVFLKRVV
jgi:hypothetical protein